MLSEDQKWEVIELRDMLDEMDEKLSEVVEMAEHVKDRCAVLGAENEPADSCWKSIVAYFIPWMLGFQNSKTQQGSIFQLRGYLNAALDK